MKITSSDLKLIQFAESYIDELIVEKELSLEEVSHYNFDDYPEEKQVYDMLSDEIDVLYKIIDMFERFKNDRVK